MEPSITIFWIDVSDDEAPILDKVARAHHASLVPIKAYSLAALTLAALAQGAVVFVARTAQEATRALGLGVDEVIRLGEIREDALTATLARARARAEARIANEQRRGLLQDDDERALAALSAAFGHQLSQPLGSASVDCEVLDSALSGVLDISDRFVEATIRGSPPEQFQDLAVRRLAMSPTHDLKRLVAEVRADLQRAHATVATLSALASRASGEGITASHLVEEIVAIMRPEFPWAAVTMRTEGACRLSLAPVTVAFALSALLVHAADGVRVGRREGGRIEVRIAEQEDAVIVEVEDNGSPVPADLRPTVLEPYFNVTRASREGGLVRVRERIRRCGGELTVDSCESSTTVRLVLPTTRHDRLHQPTPVAVSELPKKPTDVH